MALGEAFGSKRSKAAIQSQLSSQIDSKALESVASQIYANVKAATDNIPSQGTLCITHCALIAAALLEKVAADRPIPTVDLSASTPAGLYSLESIVTQSELSTIDAEAIYSLPNDTARLDAFPFK
jgi:DNA-directed RNA polymerase I subunit RPA49